MSILEAIILGAIEGVTEFLPISSTGHLTIAEKLMGFNIDDADITAFTAIIQVGAVAAVIIYFWDVTLGDRRPRSCAGITDSRSRSTQRVSLRLRGRGWLDPDRDRRTGVFRHQIEGSLRSLWVVGTALIALELRHVRGRPLGDAGARRATTSPCATRSPWA